MVNLGLVWGSSNWATLNIVSLPNTRLGFIDKEATKESVFTIDTIYAKKAPDMVITDAPVVERVNPLDFQYLSLNNSPLPNSGNNGTATPRNFLISRDVIGGDDFSSSTTITGTLRFDAQPMDVTATARISY